MRRFNPEKELKKIQHGNRNKIMFGVFALLLILTIGSTYALYQVRYSKRIIYTKVEDFRRDLKLSVYVDGVKQTNMPVKGTVYYDSITCDNDSDATAGWDYVNWELDSINTTIPNKCDIKFIKQKTLLTEKIKSVSGTNSNLVVDDETDDNNLRYIGANPNNYIWFNCSDYNNLTQSTAATKCEKWRIIGLMNNIKKSNGTKESLVKIIRADSIGDIAWDTANTNDWANASLQKSLNTTYYNGTTLGSGKGITSTTKNMIEQVVWNIGGWGVPYTDVSPSQWYDYERRTCYNFQPCTWTGYIGLMYISDYAYTTSGGSSTSRNACLTIALRAKWIENPYYTECAKNSWLYNTSTEQWPLMARVDNSRWVYSVSSNVILGSYMTENANAVRPSLYLKSNIRIVSGDGSQNTSGENGPYILTT